MYPRATGLVAAVLVAVVLDAVLAVADCFFRRSVKKTGCVVDALYGGGAACGAGRGIVAAFISPTGGVPLPSWVGSLRGAVRCEPGPLEEERGGSVRRLDGCGELSSATSHGHPPGVGP